MISTQKELKEAIRLGMCPCAFCSLKRTDKCGKEAPHIFLKKVPNLKRIYLLSCPPVILKNNLLKMIDCYFSKKIDDSSLSAIKEFSKIEYKKAIVNHIRPCNDCTSSDTDNCRYCATEEVRFDLLNLVDDFFNTYIEGDK